MSGPMAPKPPKSILDPTFCYRPSHATDLRDTFERARRELARARDARIPTLKIVPLTRKEQS